MVYIYQKANAIINGEQTNSNNKNNNKLIQHHAWHICMHDAIALTSPMKLFPYYIQ